MELCAACCSHRAISRPNRNTHRAHASTASASHDTEFCVLWPQPRLSHLAPNSPHTIAQKQHLMQRELDALKHLIHPTVPHPREAIPSRGTRQSQRRPAVAQMHLSEHLQLRRLPLSIEWLRQPDLAQSDPEVLVHYWNHRECNQYAHIMYIDNVAGKGEVGLCASTFIPRGTKIAPYLGITKSRRHSREYSATALDTVIDAADIYYDYGYQLFTPLPSTLAPPNVARYANSIRTAQQHMLRYNAQLEVSESAGFGTLWLQATDDIPPGTEILCDYGEQYALPTSSPQKQTPLSPDSQCDSGIMHELTGTSTCTLVDLAHSSSPDRQQRQQQQRQVKRAAPATLPPRRRSHQRACAPPPTAWDDTDDEPTTQEQHVIHLHPAGPAYSSDEAGDGPQPPSLDTLYDSFLPLRAHTEDDQHHAVSLSTMPILMDHTLVALRHIRAALVASDRPLLHPDFQHLLGNEPVATFSQRMLQQSFHNTQAMGYCGYIVVLQAALMHLYSWHSYPDLTDPVWRLALAQLLDMVHLSAVVLPSTQSAEHTSLLAKLSHISVRLSTSAADNGVLEADFWLSSDEVACALTLLGVPSTLWMHSDALRIYDALPQNHLILMQSTPECTLPIPLHAPNLAPTLLSRLQIGYARSHFFLLRTPASPHIGEQLSHDFYQRSSGLTAEQLDWLLQLPTSSMADVGTPCRASSSLHAGCHSPAAPHADRQNTVLRNVMAPSISPSPPLPPSTSPLSPLTSPSSPPGIPAPHSDASHRTSSSSSTVPPPPLCSASCTAASRPSRRRKHKRRARAAAAARLAGEPLLFPPSPVGIRQPQQLNIAYWNTNGHLTSESSYTLCQLIQHLHLDICVLLDTRLSQQAGEYHAAAIKHFLPGSSVVLHSTTRCHVRQAGGQRMQTMGGAMYVLTPRCAHRLITSCPDKSGLGVAGYIKLACAEDTYCIYHAHVPPAPTSSDGPATLNQRLRHYLDSQHRAISPQDYVLSQLAAWITRARRESVTIIAGGDFNMDPAQPRGSPLRQWAQDTALMHTMDHLHHPAVHNTHLLGGIPRTRLDHIYMDATALHQLRTASVLYEPHAMSLSDHCPVYAGVHCPGLVHLPRPPPQPPPPPRLELPHHNIQLVEYYQRSMNIWTQQHSPAQAIEDPHAAAVLLGALMGATTHAVQRITHRKRLLQQRVGHRSRFKDGYSPLFCALKQALLMLLALQRGLHYRQDRNSSTPLSSPRTTYMQALQAWKVQYIAMTLPPMQHDTLHTVTALLDARGTGALSPHAIAADIAVVRRMLHGRKRTEWRRQQSERIALLEDMRLTRKFKQLFRRIGVKDRTHLSLDTLRTADGLLTDSYTIHCALNLTLLTGIVHLPSLIRLRDS